MGFFDIFTDPLGTLESALTPKGTHAAESQTQRNAAVAKIAGNILPVIEELLGMQGKNIKGYETKRQNAINLLINSLNPANMAAEAAQQKNAIFGNAARATTNAANSARAGGRGDAFIAGQNANLAGDAARNAAMLDSQYLDPQKRASRVSAWLAAIEQGQKMPGIDELGRLANIIYGQPTVQVQPGLGSILGQAAGGLLGGSAGSAVGGALGGIGAGPTSGTSNFNWQTGFQLPQTDYSQVGPYASGYKWY